MIHKTAEVSDKAHIGEGTRIWNNVQVREGARIGRNCIISKDCYIDKDVVIGDNVKIQNGVSVYRGVWIENDVFIGPHVVFTNDKWPRAANDRWQITPTILRSGCSVGAGSIIICGITIGEMAMVGAGSVVTKDVLANSLYYGHPARFIEFLKGRK